MASTEATSLPSRDPAGSVVENLKDQHHWINIHTHTHTSEGSRPLPRTLISGLPPKRIYIHPDEQAEAIEIERETGKKPDGTQEPEYEWVLPVHVDETWTMAKFAEVFDAIDVLPPHANLPAAELGPSGKDWRGKDRLKRVLMAIVHDDSTVVYYIVHDGIVKPRQN
ncbi:hypothetical protein VUR80DRAFT_9368 [Thermomyces stellatus]